MLVFVAIVVYPTIAAHLELARRNSHHSFGTSSVKTQGLKPLCFGWLLRALTCASLGDTAPLRILLVGWTVLRAGNGLGLNWGEGQKPNAQEV